MQKSLFSFFVIVGAILLGGIGYPSVEAAGLDGDKNMPAFTLIYDRNRPDVCRGDIFMPEKITGSTSVALCIHGGGWNSMDKTDISGIARFLARDLGYVVYNVNYRLAGKENPWPACGDDCVAAANFIFSKEFADKTGVTPKSILVIGGSAGGHLALWTGLKIGEKCDKIISISGIADPLPDYAIWPKRYKTLFGGKETVTPEMLGAMSIMNLVRPNGPKILLTHATTDKVVPIASAKNFLAAYRSAGNEIGLFEYPTSIQEGLTGHCIWIPGSDPHRLIPRLEREITYFLTPTPVPEPLPPKTDYEISAHYYAGTEHAPEWEIVRKTNPERKPLLGWFDESDPENVDWQIKWASEHGITAYCCCWYWNQGVQRLDHWVQAFYRAQHRKHLKWYMMYANHNQPGAHSTADQIAVTKFWIDNYFKTPEYYKIDGKPVVVYCSAYNLERDFVNEAAANGEKLQPGEGMRRAMEISERMAKEAGLPGIYWIRLTWFGSEEQWKFAPEHLDWLKRGGFSAHMPYHFGGSACNIAPEAMTPRDFKKRFDFDVMCAASVKTAAFADRRKDLPFWPSLPTGYDETPRKYQDSIRVLRRTPEKFRRCCETIKAICDEKGVKRLIVAPISEWQEGSLMEPNEDYGFAYYDIIRDTFCQKPASGWQKNLVPQDIGRPLLEYPPMKLAETPEWIFDKSQNGWFRNPFGTYKAEWNPEGFLTFRAITNVIGYHEGTFCVQHNIRTLCKPFSTDQYSKFRLRMRITPNTGEAKPEKLESTMRLYWGTTTRPLVGPGGVVNYSDGVVKGTVIMDGLWHEYEIDLSRELLWTGDVNELWFQATEQSQAVVDISWMKFL